MLIELRNKRKNNKGFTLVELLVVIAIIGILAVVAVPSLMKNINKAKAADIVSDYSAIKAQVLATYADDSLVNGIYRKGKKETSLVIPATDNVSSEPLEVNDLSTEATYNLNVQNNKATLTMTIENTDVAKRVADNINIDIEDGATEIEVEILK